MPKITFLDHLQSLAQAQILSSIYPRATDIQGKVIEKNSHAKFWATKKVDYGRRKNSEWAAIKFIEQGRGSLLST